MHQEFKTLTHGNKQVFVCLFGGEFATRRYQSAWASEVGGAGKARVQVW